MYRIAGFSVVAGLVIQFTTVISAETVWVRVTVETPLEYARTPLDPQLDFADLIRQAGATGVLDPNSIEVRQADSQKVVPHALSEELDYGERGRVEFVVEKPGPAQYDIRFRTASDRPLREPRPVTPAIGVGDLLRYNALAPRPIAMPYSAGLHDLNGDGLLDLTGTWNYAYRPGWPWDGIVCYPGTGRGEFRFGELTRLRFQADAASAPQFFSHTYMAVDFADFNRDGRLDLVMTRRGQREVTFYVDQGQRDPNRLPRYAPAGTAPIAGWEACRVVDLDGDGVLDLVVDGEYVHNLNPNGWPFRASTPVRLDAGHQPCFLDVDRDGRLDAVSLQGGEAVQPDFYQVAWRRNLGQHPPQFGPAQRLEDVRVAAISQVAAWHRGDRAGLIVQYDAFQQLAVYELEAGGPDQRSSWRLLGRATSDAAVMALSDQAWPCICDWDADGDQDLLVGGGYGWPRIVMNDGIPGEPKFREPQTILASGEPIRLVRNALLGPPASWHDMGYSFPAFVDWDADGLPDLIFPNETNRIYWYRNQKTLQSPSFGPRQQVECDGYADTAELRALSARRAVDPQSNNGVYPYEPEQPFFWRTGAAFADWNGDGLIDMVTHSGDTRLATLFTQYRHADGTLHLARGRPLRLADGRTIQDSIVDRRAHWTESFRAADWDGDGLHDLFYSVAGAHSGTKEGGSIYWLRNVGTSREPVFAQPVTMRCFGEPIRIT
ncbi:MAG: FG-GAP repeat domain-containing protein, partial [Pirellulaceae bacterium]